MQTAFNSPNSSNEVIGNGVYERVKTRVIAHDLPVGKRILIEPLADQLFVSSTPVREALIRLSAEQVIQGVPKSGFFIKEISETEIRDLYTLQNLLLDWSLTAIRQDSGKPGMLKPPNLLAETNHDEAIPPQTAVRITNALFVHIARQTGNTDIIRIVANINDRTHYARERDFAVFDGISHEAMRLCQYYYQKDFEVLREGLKAYFQNKICRLPDLLRALRGAYLKNSA